MLRKDTLGRNIVTQVLTILRLTYFTAKAVAVLLLLGGTDVPGAMLVEQFNRPLCLNGSKMECGMEGTTQGAGNWCSA